MTPEIRITPDISIRGPLPAPTRAVDPDAYDALSAAIQDADITADNNEDGRPDASAWDTVVERWQACERGENNA